MLAVRVGVYRFASLVLIPACTLDRSGDALDAGNECPPFCTSFDGALVDAGIDGALDPAADGGYDSAAAEAGDVGASWDSAAMGWDGASPEPYLCGQAGVVATSALELGHADAIRTLRRSGSRLLSQDTQHRWLLWDADSRRPLAQGVSRADEQLRSSSRVDMAAALVAIPADQGIELRNASDGSLRAVVPTSAPFGLASDGSYLWSADASGLSVWSVDGAPLLSRPGDYAAAAVYAAPGELYVANGAAGELLVERLALASGVATNTPTFEGRFVAWFDDGARFVTRLEESAVVYSREAVEQRRIPALSSSSLGGHGNYLWALVNDDGPLCAYPVVGDEGEFCVQVPRRSTVEPIRGGVALRNGERAAFSADGLDLTGARPAPLRFALPTNFTQITADPGGRWAIGDIDGALSFGASLGAGDSFARLGCGRALALAGSANQLAMATADGFVRLFTVEADTLTLVRTVPLGSTALALTADGRLLATGKSLSEVNYYEGEQSLRLFAMPGFELRRYQAQRLDARSGGVFAFALAPSGASLALLACSAAATEGSCALTVGESLGGALALSVRFNVALRTELPPLSVSLALSPDGRHAAVSYATVYPDVYNMKSYVYRDGQPLATVEGTLVGFASDAQLVVARRRDQPPREWTLVTDLTGNELATLGERVFAEVSPIDSSHFFANSENVIYSLPDGREVWTGPRQGSGRQRGATLGRARVAYTTDHRVVLYGWREP